MLRARSSDSFRLEFLHDVAFALELFHRLEVVVGDLRRDMAFGRHRPQRIEGHDREGDGRQEASEPAVADMIGQGHGRVANAGGEQLDQHRCDRTVDHGHIDDEQG